MSAEGQPQKKEQEKKDEVISAANKLEELIENIEKSHPDDPKLKGIADKLRQGRKEGREKEMGPKVTLEQEFGRAKAAQMRRDAERHRHDAPKD